MSAIHRVSETDLYVPETLEQAFPDIDPGVDPMGARVLVQIRRTKKTTRSGIVLAHETQDTDKWNTAVAKLLELGPLAFRKRDTLEPWPEGIWASRGEYVRVPRFGGDRWEVDIPGSDPVESIMFAIFNDHEVIARITGDPLKMRAYI
jgi:co-chaperonin GroES (HSP10)